METTKIILKSEDRAKIIQALIIILCEDFICENDMSSNKSNVVNIKDFRKNMHD